MKPTESELSILQIFWKDGASTVRHVNEQLNLGKRVGYTNTLKIMQLMHEKGLLTRDETSRSHVYSTTGDSEEIKGKMLNQLINSVFQGSRASLLVHALGNYKPSEVELKEIKSLINKLEEDGNNI